MVEKICNFLTQKIRKNMPEIGDEKAEVINYGLHLVLGELPKNFILLLIAYILGIFRLTLIAVITLLPYRGSSGGFHLKTHLGCMTATSIFYMGNAFISKLIVWSSGYLKYIVIFAIWVFSMIMIKLYAPADTQYVPILRKRDRIIKKILSYITMTITLIMGLVIKDNVISNILIFGVLIQTIAITRFIYRLTNCKYGHEIHSKREQLV